MAILQSCCCWRSLRKGCYASAAYTSLYFGVTVGIMSSFLHEERNYLAGNLTAPVSGSFLEPESISPTTMVFNIVVLSCATVGILASIILIIGLFIDNRLLLVPWILTYQEYKAGRGTAEYENLSRTVIRYTPQPTGTSCLSTRRPPTCHESKASPTHSPSRGHRKQVQFDGLHAHWTNTEVGVETKLSGNSPSDCGSSGEWLGKVAVVGGPVIDTEPLIAGVKAQAKDYRNSPCC